VTEQLTIARLGHRGDGIADTPSGPVFVPYVLPGETVTVETIAGHPDRRHLLHVDARRLVRQRLAHRSDSLMPRPRATCARLSLTPPNDASL